MAITVDVVWGHITGVDEDHIRTIAGNWYGTGTITGSGDDEQIELMVGQWMESEIVDTLGADLMEALYNKYQAGDAITFSWRTAATKEAVTAQSWTVYTGYFDSLGYTQLRVER